MKSMVDPKHRIAGERRKRMLLVRFPHQMTNLPSASALLPPRRISLVAQAGDALREAIAAGHWQGRLPGERDLCEVLRVSRYTLRAALANLQREGIIAVRPRGHRLIQGPTRAV